MEENIHSVLKRNTPRDLFLHLLAMVTLYWSAISFTTLVWQFIDKWFSDLSNIYYSDFYTGTIRFSVSSLIIVFPIFIVISWYLNKLYKKEVAVRDSKTRKWLIYLTIFITALFIIGDLIIVINNFLGGSTTISFVLKALSILVVAGVIFGYYLDDVRREVPTKSAKYFAWFSGILVLAVIVCSFVIVGSPSAARLTQYDQQKITDLKDVQWQIVNYYQKKAALPNSLADLRDSISGYSEPTDPQTKSNYEYSIKDATNLSFELCATFNMDSTQEPPLGYQAYPVDINQKWDHSTGRVCFDRIIDKQLYPLVNQNSIPTNSPSAPVSIPVK
jgi:hypothetical protein